MTPEVERASMVGGWVVVNWSACAVGGAVLVLGDEAVVVEGVGGEVFDFGADVLGFFAGGGAGDGGERAFVAEAGGGAVFEEVFGFDARFGGEGAGEGGGGGFDFGGAVRSSGRRRCGG